LWAHSIILGGKLAFKENLLPFSPTKKA